MRKHRLHFNIYNDAAALEIVRMIQSVRTSLNVSPYSRGSSQTLFAVFTWLVSQLVSSTVLSY